MKRKHSFSKKPFTIGVATMLAMTPLIVSAPQVFASTAQPPGAPSGPGGPAPTQPGGGPVPVPQGVGPTVLQNATVFGDTPADTPVTVSIVLHTTNTSALQQFIQQSVTPGSPQYRHYLSVSQFATQFGQPQSVIQSLTSYLQSYGISTSVYPDNLDITANGTAGQFDQAFSVQLQNMMFQGVNFHGTVAAPQLPSQIASPVLAVLGLTNYGNFATQLVKPLPQLQKPSTSTAGPPAGSQTPQDFAANYNVNPLYTKGDYGQGQTIGIVTLASVDPSDAYTFWKLNNIKHVLGNRINLVNVDGGAGPVSAANGSVETTIDVEQSGAIAPQANIIVYQAPNTDYGFADAFLDAVTSNQADSISTSWGESETAVNYSIAQGQESPNYAQAFNEIFMEGASQGISMFAASGDQAAYDASGDIGTTNLSVDTPADSPYITAAGGTTLPGVQNFGNFSIDVPAQRTWGWDYFWPYWQQFGASSEASFAESTIAGSGGGYSTIFGTPWYQQGVKGVNQFSAVPYLTPIDQDTAWNFNPDPQVITGTGQGRNIPDLVMDADPETGYAVYSSTLFGSSTDWSVYGGTSFVAPQLAGVTALINQNAGTRVGFWNGQIYTFASGPQSPFTPLDTTGTSNDNLYYTGTKGNVYNPGSGLGVPNIADLATSFAQ
ncbi:MAG: protease pro-enzyme activation domain-containing protein [Acidibacillus sp.]|nr:protease pro-enzyme activation domain-containing protein [Acidibacillus sp.]